MPQELMANERLRQRGWRVFRSSSRDHNVPMTGPGRALQRVRVNSALPVGDVGVGVAISESERTERVLSRQNELTRARVVGESQSLGITKVLAYRVVESVGFGSAGVESENEYTIGTAPFDGYITEMVFTGVPLGAALGWAFRTSGGESIFSTFDNLPTSAFDLNHEPDFVPSFWLLGSNGQFSLRNLKVRVYAGEQIIYRLRTNGAVFLNDQLGAGTLTFEGYVLGRVGSQANESQLNALSMISRTSARDAATNASKLALEREKTRRAELESQARVKVAELEAQTARGVGNRVGNPFNQVLVAPSAQPTLQRRERVVPPPPPFADPPAQAEGGRGKTFVSAWAPNDNSIGYLIPDPPRGGKVNVFDGKYTIWSISGQKVGEGLVENVRTDSEIPPEARLSRNLGVQPSKQLPLSTFTPGQGFSSVER